MRAPVRIALIASLVLVPAAVAQEGSIELVPNTAGKASELRIDFRPSSQDNEARNAQSIVLAVARGFKVDPRSRRARCSDEQARDFNCPEDSRIGSGQADGTASGAVIPGGSQSFTASIDVFLAPPARAGDVAGVILQFREPQSGERGQARGRLVRVPDGPFGAELRFENLGGTTPSFPGVTVTVDRVQMRVGATRRVTRTRFVRRDGRRVRVRRTVRYTLIRNPRTCGGSWLYQVRVRYPDRQESQDGSLACSQ